MKRGLIVVSIPAMALVILGLAKLGQQEEHAATYRLPVLASTHVDQEIERLKKAVERTNGRSAMDLNALAAAYMRKAREGDHHQWPQAAFLARRSLSVLEVHNPTAHVVLGEVALDCHEFEQAVQHGERALQDDGGHEGALALLVTAHLATGDTAAADRASQRLLVVAPRQRAFALRALVHEARGDDAAALAAYDRALASEDVGECDASAWTRTLMARHHFDRGDAEQADTLCREALRIREGYPLALGLLAQVRAQQGRVDHAVSLGRSAYFGSGEAVYLVTTAEALTAAGHATDERTIGLWDEAEPVLRHEVEHEPTGHQGILARMLLGRGHPADAPEALRLAQADAELRQDAKTLALLQRAQAAVDPS